MVMNHTPRINVLNKSGIMLPPGFVKDENPKDDEKLPLAAESNSPSLSAIEENSGLTEVQKKQEEDMRSLFEKFEHAKSDSLGWVQKNEVKLAEEWIKNTLGFDPPSMCGFYMAVAIQEEKIAKIDGRKTNIILSDQSVGEEKYRKCVGLVISQGNECYLGERFQEKLSSKILRVFFGKWMKPNKRKPWCRVGDWVVFPRNEGPLINYRGTPVMYIRDDKIYSAVENPEYVERF